MQDQIPTDTHALQIAIAVLAIHLFIVAIVTIWYAKRGQNGGPLGNVWLAVAQLALSNDFRAWIENAGKGNFTDKSRR